MAKLEEPRHVGIAHMDMGEKMNIFMSHFSTSVYPG